MAGSTSIEGAVMKLSHVSVVAVAVFAGACGATVQSARFVKAAPAPDDQPIKYFSTKLPTCAYEELGLVRGNPKTGFTKLQQVLDEMSKEARRMGGDAIVGLMQSNVATTRAAEAAVQTDDVNALAGTVIKFKLPGCTM
jgi:hypothetical protein